MPDFSVSDFRRHLTPAQRAIRCARKFDGMIEPSAGLASICIHTVHSSAIKHNEGIYFRGNLSNEM